MRVVIRPYERASTVRTGDYGEGTPTARRKPVPYPLNEASSSWSAGPSETGGAQLVPTQT